LIDLVAAAKPQPAHNNPSGQKSKTDASRKLY
jgi:hypothetical protein